MGKLGAVAPVIPGYVGDDQSVPTLIKESAKIGVYTPSSELYVHFDVFTHGKSVPPQMHRSAQVGKFTRRRSVNLHGPGR